MLHLCRRVRVALQPCAGTRQYSCKVPKLPSPTPASRRQLPPRTKVDQDTAELLQRLSLVDFGSKKVVETLEDAVRFADIIRTVDTTGIQPLVSVLDDRTLHLREDVVTDGNCRQEVLGNASVTEEEYFVAPPGNIPLGPRERLAD